MLIHGMPQRMRLPMFPSRYFLRIRPTLACLVLLSLLPGCGGGSGAAVTPVASGGAPLSAEAFVGKLAFDEPALSASGRQSCASCHSPQFAHSPPNDLPVQSGGVMLTQQGLRAAPSLRYLASNGPFRLTTGWKPAGGFFWDGHADSLAQQAAGPLLDPAEMANAGKAAVVARIAASAWAARFVQVYGEDILQDADRAFAALASALQKYQEEDDEFHPFTSKYDAVLRGQAELSSQEARGLALFNDPAKGNCAACHTSARGSEGSAPLFTNFAYDVVGVPRNMDIAANADPGRFDLGLCARPELIDRDDLCGAFKVPTLRNIAVKRVYFHNGRFKSLKDVLTFYVQRDIHPEKFYPPNADGTVRKFDDLPPHLARNVNTTDAPYNRKPGDAPALSEAEIEDVLAFLGTLSDGWMP